jgi:hypothetical protein
MTPMTWQRYAVLWGGSALMGWLAWMALSAPGMAL